MDKLREKWKALRLKDVQKDVQKNIRKAFQPPPQAFHGKSNTLAESQQPPAPQPQPQPQTAPRKVSASHAAARNAAAEAALARLQAKETKNTSNQARRTAMARTSTAASSSTPAPSSKPGPSPVPRVDPQEIIGSIDDEQLYDIFTQLVTDPHFSTASEVLLKITRNIVLNPTESKYRRLRLSNKRVQEAVVNTGGAIELLQYCGFNLDFEATVDGQEDGFLVFPEAAELSNITRSVDVLQHLLPNSKPPPASGTLLKEQPAGEASASAPRAAAGPVSRNTAVILPTETDTALPDWFFELTGSELKSAYHAAVKKRQSSEVLMTKAMRERLADGDKRTYQQGVVRVRLPEGVILQGDFGATEHVAAIFEWVSDSIARPDITYELVLPDRKQLTPDQGNLREADVLPAVLINFRWTGSEAGQVKQKATLKQELLRIAKPALN